ncbi:MAG: amidase [Ruminococcaceae bacterium]|nr:amidase [Oscillospiraceae bacterium]
MITVRPYLREAAVTYAARWAKDRNPLFYNFTGIGGDCTNFVSQCVLAGSCVMNFTPDFGWYYRSVNDRAPAFTGVEYFWDFFTRVPAFLRANGGIGPFGRAATREEVTPGDVVQLADAAGDFYHTLLITAVREGELLVSAHSNDVYNRPLSEYDAPQKRFLRIEGVACAGMIPSCFAGLYTGRRLPFS